MLKSDTDIIKGIQQGNVAIFEAMFKAYYSLLCMYSLKLVKTKEHAEEIVQELFFQIWKNKNNLTIHTSIKAYLYKATYFNSMAFLRHHAVRLKYEEAMKAGDKDPFIDTSLEVNEVNQIIKSTLINLPERGREIFKLSRFDGLKYKEIADKLSISVKTVEANMSKTLRTFRANLKDYTGMFFL